MIATLISKRETLRTADSVVFVCVAEQRRGRRIIARTRRVTVPIAVATDRQVDLDAVLAQLVFKP
jgi:hypothetical protein